MRFEQYRDLVHKCSKCGLCHNQCPLYKVTGNECDTARGMLIMFKGLFHREVRLTAGINKYLDKCLRCGNCSECCPSEIPFEEIVFSVKRKWLYSSLFGLFVRVAQSAFVKKYLKKPVKITSEKFEKKAIYLGQNSLQVVKLLNERGIELLNKTEISWGVEYLLSGNIIRFRRNLKDVQALLIKENPALVIVDIPAEVFSLLIKKYSGVNFSFEVNYLGDYCTSEEFVCKYYNPDYAKTLL